MLCSFPTDHSNAVPLLPFFFVYASEISYVAFLLSLFVPPLSSFWSLGKSVFRDCGISRISSQSHLVPPLFAYTLKPHCPIAVCIYPKATLSHCCLHIPYSHLVTPLFAYTLKPHCPIAVCIYSKATLSHCCLHIPYSHLVTPLFAYTLKPHCPNAVCIYPKPTFSHRWLHIP